MPAFLSEFLAASPWITRISMKPNRSPRQPIRPPLKDSPVSGTISTAYSKQIHRSEILMKPFAAMAIRVAEYPVE